VVGDDVEKKPSCIDKIEIRWGDGMPGAKLSPEAWSYFYADILMDIARHAEEKYPSDFAFRRLLRDLARK